MKIILVTLSLLECYESITYVWFLWRTKYPMIKWHIQNTNREKKRFSGASLGRQFSKTDKTSLHKSGSEKGLEAMVRASL